MPDDTTLEAWKESQRREFNLRSRKQFICFTPSAWDKKKKRILGDEEVEAEVEQLEVEVEQPEDEDEREIYEEPTPKKRPKKLVARRKRRGKK